MKSLLSLLLILALSLPAMPQTYTSLGHTRQLTNSQTGTTYTVLTTDRGKVLRQANASAVATTLPQAGTSLFVTGFWFDVVNRGAGTVTITPTTSTINGAATLVLTTDRGAHIVSDGTNYTALLFGGGSTGIDLDQTWYLEAAGCIGATAGLMWDAPATLPAVAACVTGSNTTKGVADFANGADELSIQRTVMLPPGFLTLDVRFIWFTSATSGNVVWKIYTKCVADGESDDPSFNTASTVTDAAQGTTNLENEATITAATVTGCAEGERMHVKIARDPANGSDTLAATARLDGVELTLRMD